MNQKQGLATATPTHSGNTVTLYKKRECLSSRTNTPKIQHLPYVYEKLIDL